MARYQIRATSENGKTVSKYETDDYESALDKIDFFENRFPNGRIEFKDRRLIR
jgi:hypothetical protein